MRISDWSSDVCSSDLTANSQQRNLRGLHDAEVRRSFGQLDICPLWRIGSACSFKKSAYTSRWPLPLVEARSEEHTSELQSLMRISYAVFCLKKKKLTKLAHTPTANIQLRVQYLVN